jgi:serine/threonine-protein kinase
MKSERWQEIDRVFAEALARNSEERVVYLDTACAGDMELRKEVESLLAHDLPETILGGRAAEDPTQLLAAHEFKSEIGPYQIVRSLGVGGMGRVFLARDKRLNRYVAVKLISHYTAAAGERVRRFRQEALAASALNHPNILTIYEIGEADGDNFIATEFIEGRTLRELIDDSGISLEKCLDITKQIATALSAAHAAGIVHRDIKPANIMVRTDGLVKILDFGVAKFTQPNHESSNHSGIETTPGTVVGTAAYMSPEQARGNPIDNRTDIWSLGVILYEMIAGRRPFEGETTLDLMSAIIERQPLSIAGSGRGIPASLEDIVLKALEKNRESRYQSANEILQDLTALQQRFNPGNESFPDVAISGSRASGATTESQNSGSPTIPEDHEQPVRTRTNRHLILSGALILILLIAAGLVYWSYSNRLSPIESIAVLPFKNESNNSDLEYLSDGMPETLINSLSQLPHLSVKSPSSVYRYKGRDVDPQRIASELSVQAILEGRIVQRGDDLTISLSLVDGANGNQIWGEQYDRKMSQLISLQNEIAREVSQKLRVRLSGEEQQKLTKDYTANPEAYQLYLKGRFHVFKLTPSEVQQGILAFQRAIEIDPNYALAYVGLSGAHRSLALGSEMNPNEHLPLSKAAAQKALDLDEALAEGHTALGTTVFWYDRNWSEAEKQFKRALELNPKSADTHLFYAHLLSNTGRHEQALDEIRRAGELDPLSPFINTLEGQFLLHAGRTEEALARLKETFELAPGFWFPHFFAASAYIEKGMYSEAVAEARRASELSNAQSVSLAYEGYALAKWGKKDEARAVLDKLLKLAQQRWVPPTHIAIVYTGLGDSDATMMWLEKGLEQHDPKIAFLKVERKWNNLRDDPRFQELMQRAGF